MEVHGIRGGFTGEGAKTVIPARAVAKVSFRLVPDQRPDEADQQIADAIRAACPKGVTAEWKMIHSAAPSLTDPNNRYVEAAAQAMTEVFGNKTVYIRSGGSIPVAGLFDRHPRLKIVTHHCGGMVPFLDKRIEAGLAVLGARTREEDYSAVLPSLKRPHIDYFRDFHADTALFGGTLGSSAG